MPNVKDLIKPWLSMLRTMAEGQKSRWKEHVNKMCFAFNSTRNDSTGFSPFELLFGRKPRLPIDIIFGNTDLSTAKSYPEYVKHFKDAMKEAYKIAAEKAAISTAAGRDEYNKKVRTSNLKPGDRVLVKNVLERGGPGKLRSFWEDKVYIVMNRKDPLNSVSEVRPESQPGRTRTSCLLFFAGIFHLISNLRQSVVRFASFSHVL